MAVTSVVSESLLSPDDGSVSFALTVTVLVTVPALAGAVTLIVIAGAAPTARLARVQVTTPPDSLHDQPLPEALTKTTPAGRVSLTLTDVAAEGPALLTLNV